MVVIKINREQTALRIANLLMDADISVQQVCCACGLKSPQAVYKWTHGITIPSLESLLAICFLFDKNIDDIIDYEIIDEHDYHYTDPLSSLRHTAHDRAMTVAQVKYRKQETN